MCEVRLNQASFTNTADLLQAIANFQGQVASREVEKITHVMEVPLAGLDADGVMHELEDRAGNDFRYADGESKATGTIYMAGDVHRELLNDAYCMFSQANPLHTDLFPSIRRMEAEVVSMTASLLGGGHQGVREVQFPTLNTPCTWLLYLTWLRCPNLAFGETLHAHLLSLRNVFLQN